MLCSIITFVAVEGFVVELSCFFSCTLGSCALMSFVTDGEAGVCTGNDDTFCWTVCTLGLHAVPFFD